MVEEAIPGRQSPCCCSQRRSRASLRARSCKVPELLGTECEGVCTVHRSDSKPPVVLILCSSGQTDGTEGEVAVHRHRSRAKSGGRRVA